MKHFAVVRAARSISFVLGGLACLVITSCGSDTRSSSSSASGGSGGNDEPGCTKQPDCGACQGCFASCMCMTKGDPSGCAQACGAGAGGGTGAGAGGGGTGGGTGAGAGGAAGSNGSGGSAPTGGSSGSGGSAGTTGTGGAAGSNGSGGAAGTTGTGGAAGVTGSGGAAGSGGTGGAAGGSGTGGSAGHGTSTCLKAGSGDYSKAGPYQVMREVVDLGPGIASNQATGQFTIFYPQPFESACPHPIVAWGNGTGVTGPDVYAFFNQNAASFGVVVIAAHDSNTGSGNYHRKGLDYLLQQNASSGSKYYQKLSPRAGVSGHSQGGAGAAAAMSHANVRAFVPIGWSSRPLGTTAFLCLTGTLDISSVPPGCRSAVQGATGPAFAGIWEGGDHVTTETLAGYVQGNPGTIQMMRLYAAWFRCFLGDDPVACRMFEGGPGNCGICRDPGWAELVMKNL